MKVDSKAGGDVHRQLNAEVLKNVKDMQQPLCGLIVQDIGEPRGLQTRCG